MSKSVRLMATAIAVLSSSRALSGQRSTGLAVGVTNVRISRDTTAVATTGSVDSAFDVRRMWRIPKPPTAAAPIASLVVPGTGQLLLRQDRFAVYLGIEALGWWKYNLDHRDLRQQESAFRDLARRVARAHLSPNGPDGDWPYYEALRDWQSSGLFSRSDTQLLPEQDPTTWNGFHWQLAKGLAADSVSALAIYKRTAYGPSMTWSWTNAQLQWGLYKQTTNKRNDASKAAAEDLALVVANHLLSMVDAFATFRLEIRPVGDGRTEFRARVSW